MLKANFIPAYVLHRRKYRETSLLLDIFSSDHGRVTLVAKGARRNTKQQSVTFDPYQRYRVSWVARTELGTLVDIEAEQNAIPLKKAQVFSGFYMNELIISLLHRHEPHPDLFDAYEKALKQLAEDEPEDRVLRYFEKALLQTLGYGLVLDSDVHSGEPVQSDKQYMYEFEYGPTIVNGHKEKGLLVSGTTLLALEKETLEQETHLREAKYLLRAILSHYLGNRKLASRELYNAFIKAGTTA